MKMPFITDKQTVSDLNLTGKYKPGSIFNLFNRVKTRGGELLLEEMFKSPFTDARSINHRSSCFKYLQEINVELAIDSELTGMTAHYLQEDGPGNRLSSEFYCYKEKVEELLYRSDKLAEHLRHMRAVRHVLLSAS